MVLSGDSFSKLNLYLKVVARRPDRYHEIETLFLPLPEPADRISIDLEGAPGIRVVSTLPELPENLENLAGRAALAYADLAGVEPRWSIRIEKRIPVAAGMGGGSSDARTVLVLLNRHFRKLPEEKLAALALTLGADVPFFLRPRPAIATGVGEAFRVLDGEWAPPPLLVINPRFPVSAKWAYTHLDPARIGREDSGRLERLLAGLRTGDAAMVAENLHNDLAPALYRKFPLLGEWRQFMLRNGALHVEITGSGPTLYAVCATVGERRRLGEALRRRFPAEVAGIFDEIPVRLPGNAF